MTQKRHYHPLAALRFLRKTVLLCLLPLANALLEFSLSALLTALRQDAALLLFLCGASWVLLEASSWALDDAGVLRLRWAFAAKQERILRGEALAALTIERPLLFRLMEASRVVLYPVGQPAKRAVTLYLYKEDAQELADRLMPICDPVCHRPAGGERAAMVLLGANGLSTLALLYLAIRQSRPFPLTAEALALSRLNVLVRFAAHWLPAGAAWMLVLAGTLFGASLGRSFAQTIHYTVWHTADQLGSRGGWLSRFEFRVRSREVSYADVRFSPTARLMKRWPVFVVAGSCRPELPLFVYRSGQEALFRELLPEFRMPPDIRPSLAHRSAVFFAPAGIPFGLFLLLVLVSRTVPARPHGDAAHPDSSVCNLSGRRADGLAAGGHLATGGPLHSAAAEGRLSPLHLRAPPGCLPAHPSITVGGPLPAAYPDAGSARAGAAQGAQHPRAGRRTLSCRGGAENIKQRKSDSHDKNHPFRPRWHPSEHHRRPRRRRQLGLHPARLAHLSGGDLQTFCRQRHPQAGGALFPR